MKTDIFHSYDIRGLVGEQLDEDVMYKIGNLCARYLEAKHMAVGYDMRESSFGYAKALMRGIVDYGANVNNIGLVATEQLYFEVGRGEKYDGGVIITASHNPAKWNGAKIMGRKAKAIGIGTGLETIQEMFENGEKYLVETPGTISELDIRGEFAEYVARQANIDTSKRVKIAVDAGNGMGGMLFDKVFGPQENIEIERIYFEPDGRFPHHEANPKVKENLERLIEVVSSGNFDFGVALDGDADRAVFIDAEGRIVESVYAGIIIAEELIGDLSNRKIVHDPRITLALEKFAEKHNWELIEVVSGRSFIKKGIMDEEAIFAFENSGHFVFQNLYYSDSTSMAVSIMLRAVANGLDLIERHSSLLQQFSIAGEVNYSVEEPEAVFDKLASEFTDAEISRIDGISIRKDEWRANLRKSNTELLVRLNLEATSPQMLKTIYDLLTTLIGGEQQNDPINPVLL